VLTKALAFFGFRVHAAGTLADGRAEFDRGGDEEDAVVLDLNLPDGNGVELLRQIRARNLPVRVAVCTASKDESLMSEVRALGPDAVFPKPFDLPPLLRWLGREEKCGAAAASPHAPEIVRAMPRAVSPGAESRRIPVA
jgi:DNA-binding response OmpR family regulator